VTVIQTEEPGGMFYQLKDGLELPSSEPVQLEIKRLSFLWDFNLGS